MPGEQGLEVRPSREYWPRERMALVLLRQGLDCHLEKTLVEQAEGFWEDLRVLRLLWGRITAQSPILSLRGSTPDLPGPEKQLQRRSGPCPLAHRGRHVKGQQRPQLSVNRPRMLTGPCSLLRRGEATEEIQISGGQNKGL